MASGADLHLSRIKKLDAKSKLASAIDSILNARQFAAQAA